MSLPRRAAVVGRATRRSLSNMVKLVTFGTLCVIAFLVALCSKDDRTCLTKAAGAILLGWLLFSMPWIYAPASYAFLVGAPARQEDGWALFDLLGLVVVTLSCWRVWWGPLLWSPYLITLTMYAVAYANHLEYNQYETVLDASLSVQLAVIFLIGGPSCADRVFNCWRRVRSVELRSGGRPKASS